MVRRLASARCTMLVVCASTITALTAAESQATLLVPGTTVAPSATSLAGATLIFDSGPQPFTSVDGKSFSGSLQTRIYTSDPFSPFGLSTLTFTWQISNNGPDALERYICVRNQHNITDVCVIATSDEAVPSAVDRSINAAVVGWDYSNTAGIPAGGRSALLVMHTNVLQYYPRIHSVINGSVATVNSFGPGPLTEPEPGAALIYISIAPIALARRRGQRIGM